MVVAFQAPLSMGFSRQKYWSGLPFPSPGDLPNPGIKPRSPTLQADSLPTEFQRSPCELVWLVFIFQIANPYSPPPPPSTCIQLDNPIKILVSTWSVPSSRVIPAPELGRVSHNVFTAPWIPPPAPPPPIMALLTLYSNCPFNIYRARQVMGLNKICWLKDRRSHLIGCIECIPCEGPCTERYKT